MHKLKLLQKSFTSAVVMDGQFPCLISAHWFVQPESPPPPPPGTPSSLLFAPSIPDVDPILCNHTLGETADNFANTDHCKIRRKQSLLKSEREREGGKRGAGGEGEVGIAQKLPASQEKPSQLLMSEFCWLATRRENSAKWDVKLKHVLQKFCIDTSEEESRCWERARGRRLKTARGLWHC